MPTLCSNRSPPPFHLPPLTSPSNLSNNNGGEVLTLVQCAMSVYVRSPSCRNFRRPPLRLLSYSYRGLRTYKPRNQINIPSPSFPFPCFYYTTLYKLVLCFALSPPPYNHFPVSSPCYTVPSHAMLGNTSDFR